MKRKYKLWWEVTSYDVNAPWFCKTTKNWSTNCKNDATSNRSFRGRNASKRARSDMNRLKKDYPGYEFILLRWAYKNGIRITTEWTI